MTEEEKIELKKIKAREYARRYREEHAAELPAKRVEYNRRYREKHKDAIAQYRENNREELRDRQRVLWAERGDEMRASQKKRRDSGKTKTIKAVYFGDDNPEVVRLRKYLDNSGESISGYIKRLIKSDLIDSGD